MLPANPIYEDVTILGDDCRAFVPGPVPPSPYPELSRDQYLEVEASAAALGRLDGIATTLPDISHLLYAYIRKEAVLSSQIEGTQSSFSDLLMYEMDGAVGVPKDDVGEVSNYVKALYKSLNEIVQGAPFSGQLIQDMHAVLLASGRGSQKSPGQYRVECNWIGGARPAEAIFVPPPNKYVPRLMKQLFDYMNDCRKSESPILRAAIAHVQFETIHPFLDGNGRVGRLLIPLMLQRDGLLSQPLLYPSLYFKEHRQAYYDLLQAVRLENAWHDWIVFFAKGLGESADSAFETAKQLIELFSQDKARVLAELGRSASSALRVLEALQARPLVSTSFVAEHTGFSLPTVIERLRQLSELSICRELTGADRNLRFAYTDYLNILSRGTDI